MASISPLFTKWFGSGLTGGAAGEWLQLTALTMDILRRPKRLGGIKMDLELVWFKPTSEGKKPSRRQKKLICTLIRPKRSIEEIVVRRASLSNHQQQQEAAAAAAAVCSSRGRKATPQEETIKTMDLLQPIDHLSLDSQAKKFEPQKHAPTPSQSQNINAAQPLRGSFRLRRRSLAGDEAAAAELAASISVLAHSKPSENSAAASDVEHLREAKDQHDGSLCVQLPRDTGRLLSCHRLCAPVGPFDTLSYWSSPAVWSREMLRRGTVLERHDPGHHALQIELYDKHGNAAPWPTNPGVKVVVTWESNLRAVADAGGGTR